MFLKLFTFWSLFLMINAVVKLEQYNVDPSQTTVSGISSGGIMAQQFHFSHSNEVHGAGVFAGVPYMCGYGGIPATNTCMSTPWLVIIGLLESEARYYERIGRIDDLKNIENDPVYIFHGVLDQTVLPASGVNVEEMYKLFNANIKTVFDIEANHGQPTDGFGAPCGELSKDFHYINNCSYNGAFEMLKHLYGENLNMPVPASGKLEEFDQSEFFNYTPSLSSMDTIGYIYVPSGCQDKSKPCRLHIAYHGCVQHRIEIGDTYVREAGYIEAAEANDIIVIFPQAISIPTNPNGCWDWWGYLNGFFGTKLGNQVLATHRMMSRVLHGKQ